MSGAPLGTLRVPFEASAYRWRIEDGVRAHFEREYVGREERLREAARRSPLKDNLARAIFLVPGAGGERYLVKWFKPRGRRGALAAWLRGTPARREWANQRRLAAAGIPTADSVALAECAGTGGGGEAFLFVQALPRARNLRDALREEAAGLGWTARRSLAERLGRLVRAMHAAGFEHRDLHAGNVLVEGRLGAEPKLHLIDLHRGVWKPRVPTLARLRALSQFVDSLLPMFSRADGLRLLQAYFGEAEGGTDRGMLTPQERALGRRRLTRIVFRLAATFRARLHARRTLRCLRRSSVFGVKRGPGGALFYRRTLASRDVLELVLHQLGPHGDGAAAAEKTLPDRSLFRARLAGEGRVSEVAVKEFRPGGVWDWVKSALGHGPARRAWVAAHGLAVRGQPTARGLALFEEAGAESPGRSFLVSEWLGGALPADRYVERTLAGLEGRARWRARRALIAALAAAVRSLHRAGVHHHDLKANNLLLAAGRGDGGHRVWFLDLDRVSFGRRVTPRSKIKALAQLNASLPGALTRTDRLRFFRAYALGDRDVREARGWIREIQARTIARRHVWPCPGPPQPGGAGKQK
ncbi:MAG: hypothetical protein HYZ53_04840 [Planctomycetes bacterium]|nr:hypothetical protein [Planctomycetota bacterium]